MNHNFEVSILHHMRHGVPTNIVSKLVMIQSVMLNVECILTQVSTYLCHDFVCNSSTTLYISMCIVYSEHLTTSLPLQVTVARFSSRVPFTSQLTMAHNTDILVGWSCVTYHRVAYRHVTYHRVTYH